MGMRRSLAGLDQRGAGRVEADVDAGLQPFAAGVVEQIERRNAEIEAGHGIHALHCAPSRSAMRRRTLR